MFRAAVLFVCVLLHGAVSTALWSQQNDKRELRGKLVMVGEGEHDLVPLPKVIVSLDKATSDLTNDDGEFRISLPAGYHAGREVKLTQKKQGYAIHHPLLGRLRLPEREEQQVEVRVLPVGSKLFWTHQRIEQFIEWTANDSVKELKSEAAGPTDLSKYIVELGREYGFSEQEVRDQIRQWMEAAQKDQTNFRSLGLASFVEKNFDLAAENFLESARRNDAEAARDYELAGDSYYSNLSFRDALDAYTTALGRIHRDSTIDQWRSLSVRIANARVALSRRVDPAEGNKQLNEAVRSYRALLQMTNQDTDKEVWAVIQNSLGLALTEQGMRVEGDSCRQSLEEAVAAFHKCLKVRSKDQMPQDWANTKSNLGNALQKQAIRTGGLTGINLLNDAVAAYREALKVLDRHQAPRDWAAVHINVSAALIEHGTRQLGVAGVESLEEAVTACREALKIYDQDELPQEWATTKLNLGIALAALGNRLQGEVAAALLDQSVSAFRDALKVFIPERLPLQYAQTQMNLGLALASQASHLKGAPGVKLRDQAIAAHREALTVYSKDHLPQDWARTQKNLGNALAKQGARAEGKVGANLLEEAVAAYQAALTVQTEDVLPQDWASTLHDLAVALKEQGKRADGEAAVDLLNQAIAALRETSKVHNKDEMPLHFARNLLTLGIAHRDLAMKLEGEKKQTALVLSEWNLKDAFEIVPESADPGLHRLIKNNRLVTLIELVPFVVADILKEQGVELDQEDRQVYLLTAKIYQESFFVFDHAFELHKKWLAGHPDDLSARVKFAESHFTTGRFTEAVDYIRALLDKSAGHPDLPEEGQLSASSQAALLVLQIVCYVSLGDDEAAERALAVLREQLKRQPPEFQIALGWKGTQYFIQNAKHDSIAKHRNWLLRLIDAADGENRDEISNRLRQLEPITE